MQQQIRIERRLPFGFKGDWGKLYKRYTPEAKEAIVENNDTVIFYQKNFYVDIGQDLQFRETTDESGGVETPNTGSVTDVSRMTVKTTDAYWNNQRKQWECVVGSGDIVRVFGKQWIVGDISSRIAKRTPYAMKVFICELTSTL